MYTYIYLYIYTYIYTYYIYMCVYCIVLYRIVLYCIALYCIGIILCYIISYCITLYCMMQHVFVWYIYVYIYIYVSQYCSLQFPPREQLGGPTASSRVEATEQHPSTHRRPTDAAPRPNQHREHLPVDRLQNEGYKAGTNFIKMLQDGIRWYIPSTQAWPIPIHTPHLAASLRNHTSASRSSQQTSQIFTAFECQEIPPSFCESWGHLQTSDWCARSIGPLLALPGSVVSMRKSFSHWNVFYKNLQVWHAQLKKLWLWWSLYSDLKHTGWVVRLSVSLLIKSNAPLGLFVYLWSMASNLDSQPPGLASSNQVWLQTHPGHRRIWRICRSESFRNPKEAPPNHSNPPKRRTGWKRWGMPAAIQPWHSKVQLVNWHPPRLDMLPFNAVIWSPNQAICERLQDRNFHLQARSLHLQAQFQDTSWFLAL